MPIDSRFRTNRRAFLQGNAVLLAASTSSPRTLFAGDDKNSLRFGLMTDMHFADKPALGTRHYRETPAKLSAATLQFAVDQPDFIVELGDLIDAADSVDTERQYLRTINDLFREICPDRHYVLGNHCVDMLTKNEFLGDVEQESSFYSFDRKGFHFVVLDACFRSDGVPYGRKCSVWNDANISRGELEWLTDDLKSTTKPTIVFVHQRLDNMPSHACKNSEEVRNILEARGNVLAVFQGHSHENDLQQIGNIHYCTMRAMVEGSGQDANGFATVEITNDATIRINGFYMQSDYEWIPAGPQ